MLRRIQVIESRAEGGRGIFKLTPLPSLHTLTIVTEAPLSLLSRVGRSTSFSARAQCLIIEQMVVMLEGEEIGASWHIDKELIADELGRRLGTEIQYYYLLLEASNSIPFLFSIL